MPIFWCASEDHDRGEADHADLLHANGSIERLHMPGLPMARAAIINKRVLATRRCYQPVQNHVVGSLVRIGCAALPPEPMKT